MGDLVDLSPCRSEPNAAEFSAAVASSLYALSDLMADWADVGEAAGLGGMCGGAVEFAETLRTLKHAIVTGGSLDIEAFRAAAQDFAICTEIVARAAAMMSR